MSEESKRTPFDDSEPSGQGPLADDGREDAEISELEKLSAELAEKTLEVEQSRDAFLRERAELENFKKRMQRDKGEALRFAAEPIVRELLPVIDNLERAVEHSVTSGDGGPLVEGVRLVLKSALEILENHGVRRIDADGQLFDPNLHEAIAQVEDAGREANEVVQQYRPGYQLHERLLRPAQVSVATRPAVAQGDE